MPADPKEVKKGPPSARPRGRLPLPMSDWLPYPKAAATTVFDSVPMPKGIYGAFDPDLNMIRIADRLDNQPREALRTLGHEAGHAVWTGEELDPRYKEFWDDKHKADEYGGPEWFGHVFKTNEGLRRFLGLDPVEMTIYQRGQAPPMAAREDSERGEVFRRYPNDPSHSFAEAFGAYVNGDFLPDDVKSRLFIMTGIPYGAARTALQSTPEHLARRQPAQ